jgi:hypothetical protein
LCQIIALTSSSAPATVADVVTITSTRSLSVRRAVTSKDATPVAPATTTVSSIKGSKGNDGNGVRGMAVQVKVAPKAGATSEKKSKKYVSPIKHTPEARKKIQEGKQKKARHPRYDIRLHCSIVLDVFNSFNEHESCHVIGYVVLIS